MEAAERLHAELGAPDQPAAAVKAAADGAELVQILDGLNPDPEIRAAALLYPLAAAGALPAEMITKRCGTESRRLVRELVKLGSFGLPPRWQPGKPLPPSQAETLRRMLLAIVADVRLVTVRLAEQLRRLRVAKSAGDAARERVATETRIIFSPLANRLGIWHLKWELEDLAFRGLEPQRYHQIAAQLSLRRTEREAYIQSFMNQLRARLAEAGIAADIAGRPKHIFSIHRKMQRKGIGFDQVFDALAVRVLVDDVAQCYAALGVVHGLWRHVPGEFDDYITSPKGNFYRSLHTAVIGPDQHAVEVQIRTQEMHDHAELGVAAHWRYKEGGRQDAAFERKIAWLRQVLEPASEDGEDGDSDFIERFRSELFEDRVYVLTPAGDVLDLPAGATPLDFAYCVHTELGHRCRGARVNGRMVSLTDPLSNGDRIEILSHPQGTPSRDWLIPQFGYLVSARSRAKVRAWFRRQDQDRNREAGREILDRELARMDLRQVGVEELAARFKHDEVGSFLAAVGNGDITIGEVVGALERHYVTRPPAPVGPRRKAAGATPKGADIRIHGVGDLMTTIARCCRPVPGEPIIGFITVGRGVSIHRQDCSNILRQRERVTGIMAVDWGIGQRIRRAHRRDYH